MQKQANKAEEQSQQVRQANRPARHKKRRNIVWFSKKPALLFGLGALLALSGCLALQDGRKDLIEFPSLVDQGMLLKALAPDIQDHVIDQTLGQAYDDQDGPMCFSMRRSVKDDLNAYGQRRPKEAWRRTSGEN